jgi:hypothetical protein
MVLLMGIAALAIDGGRLYDERRTAQNAADHASLAAAWAHCRLADPIAAGLTSADTNGFENDGIDDVVTILDLGGGEYEANIVSTVDATLARVLSTSQVDVSARAVAFCNIDIGLGGYALFASGQCAPPFELALTGSQQEIWGGIHSNGGLKLSGNNSDPSVVHGPVTYVETINSSGVVDGAGFDIDLVAVQVPEPVPLPGRYDLLDYAPGGKYAPGGSSAVGSYHYSGADQWYSGAVADGLYFIDGDLELGAIQASSATFVATGQISLIGNANTLLAPYMTNGLALFSNYLDGGSDKCNETAIKWAGSDHTWSGVQYAPNGAVDMSAADNSSFNGSILAYNMALSGSAFTMTYDDSYKGEPATTIELHE